MARIAVWTGWTPTYIEDTLTIPRLQALMREWRTTPPLPVMVAKYLGIEPAAESPGDGQPAPDAQALLASWMAAGLVAPE